LLEAKEEWASVFMLESSYIESSYLLISTFNLCHASNCTEEQTLYFLLQAAQKHKSFTPCYIQHRRTNALLPATSCTEEQERYFVL